MDPLRKRRDFLAAAKAHRAGVSAFLLQGRDRGDGGSVRVGFTVTKKTGTAVVRNRIRRRLRAVVRQLMPAAGRPGFDYVLVAREQALHAPFGSLLNDLDRALSRLHDPARQNSTHGGKGASGGKDTSGKDTSGKGTSGGRASPGHAGATGARRNAPGAHPRPAPLPPDGRSLPIPPAPPAPEPSGSAGAGVDAPTPHSSDPQAPSADGGHPA